MTRGAYAGTPAVAALLALATLGVFAPALRFGFVLYDDPEYLTDNPIVRAGLSLEGVRWAFTTFHAANWHPLTWLSHMLDATLYGEAAWGHRLTSLVLHAGSTALLYLLLARWTGAPGRSVLVAALFALHPLRVESVVWVAERKDVLATFCWMAAMAAYAAWVRAPSPRRYGALLAAFVAGLLAKPMVVTLPCALLLLDVWPLGRPRTVRLVVEKLPLLALAAAASVLTLLAQRHGGAVVSMADLSFLQRLAGAAVAYATYLRQTVWPAGLAVLHPVRPVGAGATAAALALLAGVTLLAVREARRSPAPLVGWLWFLGTLVPVIGLVKAGQQAFADRFTYLPHVGLFAGAVWWLGDRLTPRTGTLVGGLAAAACAALTMGQIGVWRDSVALFTHAIAVTGDNAVAETNLAATLLEQGQVEAALPHAQRAVALAPVAPAPWLTLGRARLQQGALDAAEAAFVEAARLDPEESRAHYNLGVVAAERGRTEAAIAHYRQAIALRAAYANAHNNLGNALAAMDRLAEAEAALREAARLDPRSASARGNLAIVLERTGRLPEAIAAYHEAIVLAPGEPMLWYNLAAALAGSGRRAEAADALGEALRLKPGWAPAAAALAALGGG